jgi:D-lyxose ketol-isomerase
MLTREVYENCCRRAEEILNKAAIVITDKEFEAMEVCEYGFGKPESIGLELVVYLNTDRCCAKELILFPGQTCPEHRHPPSEGEPGKEETFRCRWGRVYLYLPGEATKPIKATLPQGRERHFTAMREIILEPGEQFTLPPNTLHWFQGGPEGAVVSEFSTKSRDHLDVYTDPEINPAEERKV